MDKEKDFEKEDDAEDEMISITEEDTEENVTLDEKEESVQTKKSSKTPKKRKLKLVLFIILILLTGAISGGGVYLWQKNKNRTSEKSETKTSPKEDSQEVAVDKEKSSIVYVSSLLGLNMRKSASLTGEVVTVLKYAAKMTVEKEEGVFYFGKDASGNEGYFAKEFTSETDPMSAWTTYNGSNYAVKYPNDWIKKVCDGSASTGFGPDETSIQICNSGKGALISISEIKETKTNYIANAKTGLDTFTESNIKVSEVDAVKLEGLTKEAEVGPQKGSTSISVVLDSGTNIMILSYLQSPSGTDYSDIFDLMVENFSLAG